MVSGPERVVDEIDVVVVVEELSVAFEPELHAPRTSPKSRIDKPSVRMR